MTGLGSRLKEARIAKGLTLDDLQNETKIQKRYLAGIEEEDFTSMPGAFYIRVFIKQYAEAVDVDAEEMLAIYQEEYGNAIQEQHQKVTPPVLQRSSAGLQTSAKLQEMLPKIIVALFIVVILVISYLLLRDKSLDPNVDSDPLNPNNAIIENPTEQPKPSESVKEEPVQKLQLDSTSGESSTFTLANTEELKLVVTTSGDSWISVTDEQGEERMPGPGARVMLAGESVEIDASNAEKIRIRVGNYSVAELVVNGQKIDYPTQLIPQNIIITHTP
ncbi:RodZ domain-containing protein [Sporosarcina sp. PTS2304]|uniref:helix-turn-helix domain-containing protein n=1 Tax=Sporosarcina sp. PTS2304 TaxID=2283194 RepID=UPI0013B44BD2|nr:RodZ domain-containing protein [Sporosarcina sp. PTS2304]